MPWNTGPTSRGIMARHGVESAWGGTRVSAAPLHAADSSTLESSAVRFKQFVLEKIAQCQRATKNMRERIAAHDLHGAQQAWLTARSGWESSDVITSEFFPDLARKIDARSDDQRGFHAIEAKLFGAHDVRTLPAVEALVDDLADFERQLRATTLTAQGLLNGTTKLAYEIGENKAAGGESPVSGHSLAELRGNVASIAAAYEQVFARAIKKRDAGLAKIFSLDLEETRALLSVRSLKKLDRARLRNLSAWLASDLVLAGQEIGLEKPDLATE
jgi:iron uptake system EfeUOB component EfeO/EfeM